MRGHRMQVKQVSDAAFPFCLPEDPRLEGKDAQNLIDTEEKKAKITWRALPNPTTGHK